VSLRSAPCPGCGATLEFKNAATLVVVCPFCGSASYRSDVALESIGKVAEVAPIESLLELGARGRHADRGWRAVGQIQLDHGAGPWNEWCLAFDDGTWGWLAEAQGQLLLTRAVEGAKAPTRTRLRPGNEVSLGETGLFRIAEVGSARVTAVRGEIPARVVPGQAVHYADLSGPGGLFGTLDYGTGDELEAAYAGRVVAAEEMGLDPSKAARVERRAAAERVSCPHCAGILELRDPDSVRAACGSCGSLLDTSTKSVHVLGMAREIEARPDLPLGGQGVLEGETVETLAFLVRSVKVEGVRYAWHEYLLRRARGGYRWLVESHGHWLLADGIPLGDVGDGAFSKRVDGREFQHFQAGNARVDAVYGEVYWEVRVGETVKAVDYVCPPRMLTLETTQKEQIATLGRYATRGEVESAFSLAKPLREPVGVAPAQPNPHDGPWGLAGCGTLLALALLMVAVSNAAGNDHSGILFPGALIALVLAIPPIAAKSRRAGFERARWEDSDHPGGPVSVSAADRFRRPLTSPDGQDDEGDEE
jgi:hypothetical protein